MGFFDLFRRPASPPPRLDARVTVSPTGFTLETSSPGSGRSVAAWEWVSVSGSCHSPHKMKGIDVCTLVAPYIQWIPDDAEGGAELVAELDRRGLLGPDEEVKPAWETALGGILDRTVAGLFDLESREEAERLLAPHRTTPRMALALVELSGGDLEELRKDAQWAGDDPTSVIYSAWYAK